MSWRQQMRRERALTKLLERIRVLERTGPQRTSTGKKSTGWSWRRKLAHAQREAEKLTALLDGPPQNSLAGVPR